jgi:TatA/E family protein of Tat protein translocase
MNLPLALLDSLGGSELMVVLVVILIFFGGEKMPEFARGLGKAIREFKKAAGDVEQEFKRAIDELPEKPSLPSLKQAMPLVPQATPLVPQARTDPPAPMPPATLQPGDRAAPPEEPAAGHGIDA